MIIRIAQPKDFEEIWPIFNAVIRSGDTYTFPSDMSKRDAQGYWMHNTNSVYVAELDNRIVGTYILKANQLGQGSHISNASFMVDPNIHGKGIGKALGQHCISEAQAKGFTGMQFNIVVSTNTAAVSLWKKLGFRIIGTTPKGFQHPTLGLVDTYIMFRDL